MDFMHILREATAAIKQNKRILMNALLFPFVMFSLLDIAQSSETIPVFQLIFMAIDMVLFTVLAIVTHRIILLGSESIPPWGLSKWSFREYYFTAHIIGLGFIAFVLFASTKVLAMINLTMISGWMSGLLVLFWIVSRLSLVFPGIAVDQGVSFKLSWKMTRQHQVLMILVIVLFPAFLNILISIVSFILSFLPYHLALVKNIIVNFTVVSSLVLTVAMLSVCYRIIAKDYFKPAAEQV